ncbi:type IV secretion system DNA-binding domain-containing protein [Halomonas sp. 3A7M]|uniref:type IV secretion system DNA-binding domain-containing protein n=1 Tax=Halomonas sp. 3A7M TaxID=2742616 RepID=UPI0018688CC5|nr:type IV secretion system DNA-binding domain-containing protein [Halomonas sp. 3A7M]
MSKSPGLDAAGLGKLFLFLMLILPLFSWFFTAKFLFDINPDNARQVFPFILKNTFNVWPLWSAILGGAVAACLITVTVRQLSKSVFKGAYFHHFFRGSRLVSQQQLAAITRKRKQQQITIANIPMPLSAEVRHVAIGGATGTGKTTVMKEMMLGALKRGDKQIILDPDGDFLKTFYREGDKILNPFDARTEGWSFFNEIRNDYDFNRYAQSMVVPSSNSESEEWNSFGRLLLQEVGKKLYQTKSEPTIEEVYHWTNRVPLEMLEAFVAGTDAQGLFTENERASGSVQFVLSNKLAPHLIMPHGDFSLTDWLEDKKSKTLFITWNESTRAAIQPLISCWVDTIIQIILGRPTEKAEPTWLWLDELESLGKLPTLGAGLTRGRKKEFRIVSGYQSSSQLIDVYGEHLAETMLSNHRTNLVFAVGRQGKKTAERMSDALGEHEVRRDRPEKSYRWGEMATRSDRREVRKESVVIPSEIMALDDLHGYVSFPGSLPIAKFEIEPINFIRRNPVPAFIPKDESGELGLGFENA